MLSKIFGKTVAVDVIQFLIDHRGRDYDISTIAKRTGRSRGVVTREVKKLHKAGVVKASRKYGSAILYQYDMTNQKGIRLFNLDVLLPNIDEAFTQS